MKKQKNKCQKTADRMGKNVAREERYDRRNVVRKKKKKKNKTGGRKWMFRGGWVRINLIKTCRGGAAPKTGRYLLRVRLYRYGETIYNL